MMPVVTRAMNAPIQPKLFPALVAMAPIGALRVFLPSAISAMMRGIDQVKRKITQGMMKEPPPFCATMREKRQILPAPTATPNIESSMPRRLEKNSCLGFDIIPLPRNNFMKLFLGNGIRCTLCEFKHSQLNYSQKLYLDFYIIQWFFYLCLAKITSLVKIRKFS